MHFSPTRALHVLTHTGTHTAHRRGHSNLRLPRDVAAVSWTSRLGNEAAPLDRLPQLSTHHVLISSACFQPHLHDARKHRNTRSDMTARSLRHLASTSAIYWLHRQQDLARDYGFLASQATTYRVTRHAKRLTSGALPCGTDTLTAATGEYQHQHRTNSPLAITP